MLPKPPPREGHVGFLLVPPYRVQGTSIAGEATALQVPELDLGFDMGSCPRAMLSSKYVAISHGHMDHIGGLAYYCSQRHFQGMGVGTIVCDVRVERAMERMLSGFIDLEKQQTPYEIVAMEPEQELEIKNTIFLRAFEVEHNGPAFGYSVIERRSKLKEEFAGLPQDKLRELKGRGIEITRILEVPLVAYLGDTLPGPWLLREDVLQARVVISECTFVEAEHKDRAKIGRHMHLDDVLEWLPLLQGDALVLTHLSRRSNIASARKLLRRQGAPDSGPEVLFLMDHRTNRARYEQQLEAVGETESDEKEE